MTAVRPPGPASTFGWDTVYAVTLATANRVLAERWKGGEPVRADSGDGHVLRASVRGVSIVGGDGVLARLRLDLADAALQRTGQPDRLLGSIEAFVTVPLAVDDRALRIDPSAARSTVTRLDGEGLALMDQARAKAALQHWLDAAPSLLGVVLAEIDVGAQSALDGYAWLRPTSVGCCLVEASDPGGHVLALLAMTGGRPAPDNPQVSSNAIPPGCDSGFLIASARLLGEMLGPAVVSATPHLMADDLRLEGHTLALRQPVLLDPTRFNGSTYPTRLVDLTISLRAGEAITFEASTEVQLKTSTWAQCRSVHRYTMASFTNGEGQVSLNLVHDDAGSWTTHAVRSERNLTGELIEGISLGVATLAYGYVLGWVAGLAVGLVSTLLTGGRTVQHVVASRFGSDAAPALDGLAMTATAPFSWPGRSPFHLSTASLNDSLQLGGELRPATGAAAGAQESASSPTPRSATGTNA